MKFLGEIREKDIDPIREQLPDKAHINYREAAKVVLFDDDGNIALIHYPPKENYPGDAYYIPGGGLEAGESVEEALRREAREETGCAIKNITEVGYGFAYMRENRLKQKAYAFTALVDGEKGKPQYTDKEKEEKIGLVWKPLAEAIKLVDANQVNNFAKKFAQIVLAEVKNRQENG